MNTEDKNKPLAEEIEIYRKYIDGWIKEHLNEWVVVRLPEKIDFFKSFDDAAEFAINNYGRGPYLIRRIGEPEEIVLSAPSANENW